MAMTKVGTAAYSGASSSAATFTVPATAKAGDVAFVAIQFNDLNKWAITPAGWTLLAGPMNGTLTASYLYGRELGASDPGNSAVFTLSGAAARVVGAMSIWNSVDFSKVRVAGTSGSSRSNSAATGLPASQLAEETKAIAFWLTAEPYTFANQYTMSGGATLHSLDEQRSIGTSNPVLQAIASHRIPLVPTTGYTANERLSISNASGGTTYVSTFVILVPEKAVSTPTLFGTFAARPTERQFYGSVPKPGPVTLASPVPPAVLTSTHPVGTLQTRPITLAGVLAPRQTVSEFLGGRVFYRPRVLTPKITSLDRPYERQFKGGAVLRGANPVISGALASRPAEQVFTGQIAPAPVTLTSLVAERVVRPLRYGAVTSRTTLVGYRADRAEDRLFYGDVLRGAIRGTLAPRPEVELFYGELLAGPATLLGDTVAERIEVEVGPGEVTSITVLSGALAPRPVVEQFYGKLTGLPPTLRGLLAERPEDRHFYGTAFAFGPVRYRRPVRVMLEQTGKAGAALGRSKTTAKLGKTKA